MAENHTHWRIAAQSVKEHDPACNGGVFASFISGSKYLAPVLCLHRSLTLSNTTCRFVLVHDDRPIVRLQESELGYLSHRIGHESLVPLTSLFSRLPNKIHRVRMNFSWWLTYNTTPSYAGAADTISLTPRGRGVDLVTDHTQVGLIPAGRRLYDSKSMVSGLYTTHLKLWLYGLPYKRVVVLDADMVVVANIDFLLKIPLRGQTLAAVSACSKCECDHVCLEAAPLFRG